MTAIIGRRRVMLPGMGQDARGASVGYAPDPEAVATVDRFNAEREGGDIRREGMFGPEQPVPPGADPFQALLGRLGRTV